MSGGSYRHFQIIGNLNAALHTALKDRPCSVGSSDLRLQVLTTGLYTYPDIVVICGEPQFADEHKDMLLNPTFLAEVLSPSTEGYDRGLKSTHYRAIESLKEYALVSQSEPRIEVYRRMPNGGWLLMEFAGLDAMCRFASLECNMPLAEIYRKVVLDS